MLDLSRLDTVRDEASRKFLKQAYDHAWKYSDDTRTKTAALIVVGGEVVSVGCNVLPYGVEKRPERLERPLKYKYIAHAEREAYYSAAKNGVKTEGSVMYTPWLACVDCTIAIIEGGSREVVSHRAFNEKTTDKWADDIGLALGMLEEAGVKVKLYDGEIGEGTRALFDGKEWVP
jgi:dCMP deaminase